MELNMQIVCLDFRPLQRNTLQGFARIKVVPWKLAINDVALHERDGKQWAQLPSRPMLDSNRQLMLDETGKPRYSRVLEFIEREVADQFSASVVKAVADFLAASKRIDEEAF
jgi:hypothetical protein